MTAVGALRDGHRRTRRRDRVDGAVPPALDKRALPDEALRDHIGGDIGPAAGTRRMAERLDAPTDESGDLREVDLTLVRDDGVADGVEPAPSRATGELRELAGRQQRVLLTVPLLELFDDHRPRGHVDAERERLCGEAHLDEPPYEQRLDELLEHRHHAGVVRGDPPLQRIGQPLEPQRPKIVGVGVGGHLARDPADLPSLVAGGQRHPVADQVVDGAVAPGAAEHEHDRRQPVAAAQHLGQLAAPGRAQPHTRRAAPAQQRGAGPDIRTHGPPHRRQQRQSDQSDGEEQEVTRRDPRQERYLDAAGRQDTLRGGVQNGRDQWHLADRDLGPRVVDQPVPVAAGLSRTRPAPCSPTISWGIVEPVFGSSIMVRLAASTALRTASVC